MVTAEWLRKTELFRGLEASQLDRILSYASVESFPERTTIFRRGEEAHRFFILVEGAVALAAKTGEKNDFMTSKIEKEGTVFGMPSILEPFHYNVTGTCLQASKVLVIEAGPLRKQMEEDPKMGMEIMKSLASIYFHRLNEMRDGISKLLHLFKSRSS
jgi:CRP-like cAMP-binding protein